ncbi:speckle-type POZ protein [Parasteatoda tepidariorum]|uniref:speckle-type POZ protein n=1 Tax=Parasteatoda tepidariorum TaxID=114398 RepID=UPI00077FD7A4|nr:speckle-type POZ protein [Parasteatoda tepidariorum]
MDDNFLIWSCNRRKFMKVISSKDEYKERLGCKLNSVWYLKIRILKEYDYNSVDVFPGERSYYTNWEFRVVREHGLNATCVNAKLVSNTKVLVDKDLYFNLDCTGSDTFYCDTTKLTDYYLDCVLRFPESNGAENIIEEQTLISELNYLVEDFQAMFDKRHLTDVTLQCGSDVLKAHKIILCTRSPVFEAMFASPMQESKNNTVIIMDLDSSVFGAVINFMYSGRVKINSTRMACDLLYAGEKYQIKGLKEGCIKYLKSVLSVENAIKILEVSDLYDIQLKSNALNFVKGHFEELKCTIEWSELKSKNITLALEVYSIYE